MGLCVLGLLGSVLGVRLSAGLLAHRPSKHIYFLNRTRHQDNRPGQKENQRRSAGSLRAYTLGLRINIVVEFIQLMYYLIDMLIWFLLYM
jgi:hypothetical protein